MGVASQNSTLPRAITTFPASLSLSSPGDVWPRTSNSSFLHAAMNLRPPSVTASTLTSASNTVTFQPPVMPNAWISLCTQSVHFFYFPPRPLRTAPSRFPNTIRFGSHPPLIRMSAPVNMCDPDIDSEDSIKGRPSTVLFIRTVLQSVKHLTDSSSGAIFLLS